MVVVIVTIKVGKMMSAGFALPALALKPITVVGKSWMEVAFITTSIIMAKFAFPLLSSRACIALIPMGVAALPTPSMFAETLSAMIFWISSLSTLKIFLISGRKSLASLLDNPLASISSIKPSQTTYTAHSSKHSSRASVEAPIISDRTSDGLTIKRTSIDESIIKSQKIFMFIFMLKLAEKDIEWKLC